MVRLMIDISKKRIAEREAVVEGSIRLDPSLVNDIKNKRIPKGDVLEAAKISGMLAAKKTPELIPHCHPIPIESVKVEYSLGTDSIKVTATVKAEAKTGVEMEAILAVSTALVVIYDMCKFRDRGAVISDIRLIKKSGGKSGVYVRKD